MIDSSTATALPDVTRPTDAQYAECARLRAYFPYRIVWAATDPATGVSFASATATKHKPNKLVRAGWHVWVVSAAGVA